MIKKILIFGPHTDDGEWGCGASIAKWVEDGHKVFYVAFSAAEESVQKNLPESILRQEIILATKELGILPDHLKVFEYRVRYFPRDRQEILEDMIRLRAEVSPDIVVIPCTNDTHQDHEVINREAFRAFKRSTLLGYEIPWNNRRVDLNFFNVVSRKHVDRKIASIAAYRSQLFRAPNYIDLINSLAIQRGNQVGFEFAEAFEVIRWVET